MTPVEILQRVHLRFEKNTDYPESTSEDHLLRTGYLDDAITTLEKEVFEGVEWDFLKASTTLNFGGTGTDALPADFLDFMRQENSASLKIGNGIYNETNVEDGNKQVEMGNKVYIFWQEGNNIRTYPEASGSITFNYMKKATRYPLGTEVTEMEVRRPLFFQEYILANLYLDDGNVNQYNAHMNIAKDELDTMRFNARINRNPESSFAFGM